MYKEVDKEFYKRKLLERCTEKNERIKKRIKPLGDTYKKSRPDPISSP